MSDEAKSPPHAPSSGATGAAPGKPLGVGQSVAGRFHLVASLEGPPGAESFIGRDGKSGHEVVVMTVSSEHAKLLEAAKTLEHAHLARLLDVVEVEGGRHVAVAERILGQTLAELFDEIGRKQPVDAVRSALRIADALNHLHEAGAVHGFVHPRSVIDSPEDREAPALTFFPAGDLNALNAPERSPDAAPSIADDTWATAGLLHWMLTGSPPRAGGYASETELENAGVADPALRSVLHLALAADPTLRQSNLRPLRRELARWFVEHAGEELVPPGSHRPPPLPHGAPSPASARPSTLPSHMPRRQRRKLEAFAAAAIVLGLLAGAAASLLRPKRVQLMPRPQAAPPPTASAVELGDVPVTGGSEARLGNKLATCMSGYLPKGAFGKTPEVDWLCVETDPRNGAERLRIAVVAAAPKGPATDAMKIFARIGWYDMAAFAVIRAGCCPNAAPIALPDAKCSMDGALREIGEAVIAMKDVEQPLKTYTESIHCELNRGGSKMLRRTARPEGGEDTAFLELVKHLE